MAFNVAATWFEDIDSSQLRSAIEVENIIEHLEEFQEIADENDGNRASGLPGFDPSAQYVFDELFDAGYQVSVQPFEFPYFQELSEPELEQISPTYTIYPARDPDGFYTMMYSGSGDVIGVVEPVDLVIPPGVEPNTSTSGCEPEDFQNFVPGSIALIQRGSCTFATKAINAENAGAIGVVIFNEGQEGRTDAILGTLGEPVVDIPVVGAAYAIGEELYLASLSGVVTVHIFVDAMTEIRSTYNIIAETVQGRDDWVVVIGAHLDSVPEGPGINDNGSGVATILEIALQMADLEVVPVNKVRFAFWGAEEEGLLGSQYYVDNLSERELNDIALNLNFDMIGSPNYVRFVYDGDGSDTELEGPKGSENIEHVFLSYFEEQGLPVEPTAFDGRSDYGPFIDVGIPAGGLFTGADGIKTEEQAAIYGGIAGQPYDPYYHTPDDDLYNISTDAFDQMSDAAAHAVFYYAMTFSFGRETGASLGGERETTLWRGSRLQK
jgi:Zn-dependent M28 family amino/carboxypeptidase